MTGAENSLCIAVLVDNPPTINRDGYAVAPSERSVAVGAKNAETGRGT
ncbi:MAG: hypothetical protein Q7R41_09020 [Phycisphaerales bacterium]|nr:hypothetical protein [Phycisphaerales bacterium]